MLEYQSGEYCICIWDSDKTNLRDTIRSLGKHVNDEKDASEQDMFTMTVRTFDHGTYDDKAKKILEEAGEVRGALQYEGIESGQVLYELAETVDACLNLVGVLGCTAEDFQRQLDRAYVNNSMKEH